MDFTYASQKAMDQLWSIRNQVFKMFVDGVDGENGIFPNVRVTMFLFSFIKLSVKQGIDSICGAKLS
jgi:hypothetical protein